MALDTKLSKVQAGYLPPEDGPFECGNCIHFYPPHKCELVEGVIKSAGCCNLYTPDEQGIEESDDSDDE